MRGYGLTLKRKWWGILFRIGFLILPVFGVFHAKGIPYVLFFMAIISLLAASVMSLDILFHISGRFVVCDDGVDLMLKNFRLNKFSWDDLKRVDVRRKWGQIIEVALWTKKNRVKCFGRDIEGYPAFFNEILDSVTKHGGVEIKELEW